MLGRPRRCAREQRITVLLGLLSGAFFSLAKCFPPRSHDKVTKKKITRGRAATTTATATRRDQNMDKHSSGAGFVDTSPLASATPTGIAPRENQAQAYPPTLRRLRRGRSLSNRCRVSYGTRVFPTFPSTRDGGGGGRGKIKHVTMELQTKGGIRAKRKSSSTRSSVPLVGVSTRVRRRCRRLQ